MIHINSPNPTRVDIDKSRCPDCKKQSYFVNRFYEWYGSMSTCMRCGREYADGEWLPLTFSRNARKINKDAARTIYKEAKCKMTLRKE